MKYRNPQIPEGINVSDRHPLRELLILVGGALLLIIVLSWLFGQFGGRLARLLPFEREAALAPESLLVSDAGPELQAYLDQLGGRVAAQMDLPDGMQMKLHFSGKDTFNAFATLGGNILLYRGLVAQLPHENALAMLLAHEMTHVRQRDPIVGLGRGVGIQLVVTLLLGNPSLEVLGNAGIYTQLHFSREMERTADEAALTAVNRLYGHVGGADDLFEVMHEARERADVDELPAVFGSHPLDHQRLQAIADAVRAQGWSDSGATTPLPGQFSAWMQESAARAEAREDSE